MSAPAAWPNDSKCDAEVTPVKSEVSWEVRVVGGVVHWTFCRPTLQPRLRVRLICFGVMWLYVTEHFIQTHSIIFPKPQQELFVLYCFFHNNNPTNMFSYVNWLSFSFTCKTDASEEVKVSKSEAQRYDLWECKSVFILQTNSGQQIIRVTATCC